MQIRSVECVDIHGLHNSQCDPTNRPVAVHSCATGISCTSEISTVEFEEFPSSESPNEVNYNEKIEDVDDISADDDDSVRRKHIKVVQKSISDEMDDETEETDDDLDMMQGDDPKQRKHDTPLAYQYSIPRAERLVDPNVPNEPT